MDSRKLSSEEENLLTPFNCFVFSLALKENKDEGKIIPCWLVTSEEARERYRERAFDQMNIYNMKVSNEEIEDFVIRFIQKDVVGKQLFEDWIECELAFKQARAEGNPRAFFAEFKGFEYG
jgi:hypothetical protein